MSSSFAIQRAEPCHYQAIESLYVQSVRANARGFVQDLTFHGSLTSKIAAWRTQGGELLVGLHNGIISGIGALAPKDGNIAELCKLHVDAEHQGLGIGRKISEALIAHAQASGFSAVLLHVTATQSAALCLYRRLGFRQTSRNLFKTQVFGQSVAFDTIHMALAINPERIDTKHVA